MADTKISGMTAASALGGTELIAGVQSGANVKITATQIQTFVGSGITIGTTAITSGTTTRILYDNAGIVGEYTLSGSGTVVAMATGASLTTPALGVATATSLAIGGATLGSNALAVTGHLLLEGVTSTGATGTGLLVFGTSPTFTTPVLGTPSSGTLTSCTGLPEAGLTLADNTTNNSSTSNHGFLLKLNNSATAYMNGTGAWSTPAGATYSAGDGLSLTSTTFSINTNNANGIGAYQFGSGTGVIAAGGTGSIVSVTIDTTGGVTGTVNTQSVSGTWRNVSGQSIGTTLVGMFIRTA